MLSDTPAVDALVEELARILASQAGYDPDETWEEFDRTAAIALDYCDNPTASDLAAAFPRFTRWQEFTSSATALLPIIARQRNEGIEAAIRKLELRQGLYGGEPMTANEAAIARSMLEAIRALKEPE